MTRVFTAPCGKGHAEQHEAAYALLRRSAASLFPDLLPDAPIRKTEKGKPFFPDRPDIHFSIAHTPGMAAVAVGDVPCGVDVEEVRDLPERVRLRFFPSVSPDNALAAWTEREACGKLTGEGFFAPPPPEHTVAFRTSLYTENGRTFLVSLCVSAEFPGEIS